MFGTEVSWAEFLKEREGSEIPAARLRAQMAIDLRDYLYDRLEEARATQAKYYDAKHIPMSFNIGDKVLLNSRNIKTTRPSKKKQPPPVLVEGEEQWEVEKVLDSRIYYGKLQYLVKWLEYSDTDNEWLKSSELDEV